MRIDDRHPYAPEIRRLRTYGVGAAVVGGILCAVGAVIDHEAFFRAYLFAFIFWVNLSLGCLALLMLHHVVAGGWGFVTQRLLEPGALAVGLMAILFIPLLFGLHDLYEWTHEEVVAEDPLLLHKRPYLNVPFFIIRAVIYFAAWFGAALLLRWWSTRLEETGDLGYAIRMRRLSAGGLVAFVFLVTFASVDWGMSLEPHWFSTIYGFLYVISQALSALAFIVLVLVSTSRRGRLFRVLQAKQLHDLGNLMLALVILWTYMMFAQYLIIWAGNVPEEVVWYLHRQEGAWGAATVLMVVFHFVLPFFLLLSRRTKRSRVYLPRLAAGLLAVHMVYVAWLILPSYEDSGVLTYVMTPVTMAAIGGLWGLVYVWQLSLRPQVPERDPRMPASFVEVRES